MIRQPQRDKHLLQKISAACGIICFIAAVICILVLAIYRDDLTMVYNASFAASAFFFFSVGIVLRVIARTNLPKIHGSDSWK